MGALFGSKNKMQPTPVARMPDPEDPAVKDEERRKRLAIAARSGRASTILTPRRPTTGGAGTVPYANSLLGQAS